MSVPSSSSSSSSAEEIWSLLTSRGKLERDKGADKVEKLEEMPEFLNRVLAERAAAKAAAEAEAEDVDKEGGGWEKRLGFLLLCKSVLSNRHLRGLAVPGELPVCCLKLLSDREARVRGAAGEVLGCLCGREGPKVYEAVRENIFASVKEDLERERPPPNRKEAEAFYHDTAGWRNLETSLQCLQHMVSGCGPLFSPHVDRALLDLLSSAVAHQNRFVRETSFSTLTSLVSSGCLAGVVVAGGAAADGGNSKTLDFMLADLVGAGMADNWSQVRLAASVTCRHFFQAVGEDPAVRERYFPSLLPPLCLNRYYMAEGVRVYCQDTWRTLVGDRGIFYVEKYLDEVFGYYSSCAEADNHAVREAACHCVAELATKLDRGPDSRLRSKSDELLSVLLRCFSDDSWPVRDAACLASGRILAAFPDKCAPTLPRLVPLMVGNLKDPISSVRQGAALSLASAAKTFPAERLEASVALVREGLRGLKEQPEESLRYGDLSTGPADFGVAKRARDNDPDLHENQQMYSCGSLAPKMGRGGGGCTDAKFRKPSEPWEFADGCVHLLAELLSALGDPKKTARGGGGGLLFRPQEQQQQQASPSSSPVSLLHPLLADVAAACEHRHYTAHLSFLESVMGRLPDVARALDKRTFKLYLEDFVEPAFYCCDMGLDETGGVGGGGGGGGAGRLAAAAAEQCLRFLSSHLGPNILRGRVEQVHPRYLATLDQILDDDGGVPMDCSPSFSSSSSSSSSSAPVGIPMPSRPGNYAPSLGGTPT